jgi:YVTN family beta-propeller protein
MRHLAAALACTMNLALANVAGAAADPGAPGYRVEHQYTLGGAGGWDYLTLDADASRLFIARADRVLVINTRDGALLKTIPGTAGVHGVALAPDLGKGFTSNGRADSVTVFDLQTLEPTGTIAVEGNNPDAILYDAPSRRLFTFNGRSQDISVIDPAAGRVVAHIPAGGKPEFAVSDGAGRIFVNIEDTAQVRVIDSRGARLTATWTLPNCEEPTGIALDAGHQRLFSVCQNRVLSVTDARSGAHVAEVPIGEGPDAVTVDAERGLVFSSNGQDGTLTVIREVDPDHYAVVSNVATQKSARTMALDRDGRRIYLVAAQFGPMPESGVAQPHPRPPVLEGSFKVLVVSYH